MHKRVGAAVGACLLVPTLGAGLAPAQAADQPAGTGLRPSQGYIGLGVGRARFDGGACVAGFSCDNRDTMYKLFAGTQVHRYFGVELGYLNFGEVGRNGGETEAHGINLSLVGTVPVTPEFGLVGKVGTLYSRTKVSAATPLVATGNDSGFGLSYGLGARYDLTRNWAVRADWDRYRADFAGGGDRISVYSLGVQYKF